MTIVFEEEWLFQAANSGFSCLLIALELGCGL